MESKKTKIYDIKVPVYISESLNIEESSLFAYSYEEMIQKVKNEINNHNETGENIASTKRNTTKKKEINSIEYFEHNFGSDPILLIKMDASTTNYRDVYVQKGEEVELGADDKIGSKNHWLLLYPRIIGLNPSSYCTHWLIFIYADPNKDFGDVTNTAKLFLRKVLGIKYRNVKTTDILEEIKKTGNFVSKLQVNYSSVVTDSNDTNLKLREYLVGGKISIVDEAKYEDVPINETWDLLNDYDYTDQYQKRVIKITQGKKEYKIISGKQLAEVSTALEEVVEETFNMTSSVTEDELESNVLYNEGFIIEKLKPIIENYMESYDK